jgi:hypothetical protein
MTVIRSRGNRNSINIHHGRENEYLFDTDTLLQAHATMHATMPRWIKFFLHDACVDTSIFSAHSTRGASAPKAASCGLPIDSILKTGRARLSSIVFTTDNLPFRLLKSFISYLTVLSSHVEVRKVILIELE